MRVLLILAISIAVLMSALAHAQEQIITIRPLSDKDTRYDYPDELLREILARTASSYGEAILVRSAQPFSRDRTKVELKKGTRLHVIAEAPKPGWEEDLLEIRIPIRKGIQGYRTFLIQTKSQAALSQVETLEQLMAFHTGSGAQWSTRRVMEDAGFYVVTGLSYEALFKMLMADRFITFGRGINEIYAEYDAHTDDYPTLAIEKYLALYIPLPTYFFVSPQKPKLAERIEVGLRMMVEDGSFDAFFMRHHRNLIESAKLSQRRIFKLHNPNLSAETPLDVDEYWFRPGEK